MISKAFSMATALTVAAFAAQAESDGANTLTDAEKAAGWTLLWDGRTLDGWVGEKGGCKAPPTKGWKIEDGILTVLPTSRILPNGRHEKLPKAQAALGGGGDLVTKETFRDFELSIDFRLTAAANSGIKYFYNKDKFRGTCEEYQLLDPAHPDAARGRDGNRRVAALYDVMPSTADKVVKPAGEWNTARIVSKGSHVEHWLNGVKVLEYERGSELFREKVKRSKFKSFEKKDSGHWGEAPEGHIKLQDHTDSTVSFRNIKIRRL